MFRTHRLRFIEPQLASSVDQPPTGNHWIHEIKHDGYRSQIAIERGQVRPKHYATRLKKKPRTTTARASSLFKRRDGDGREPSPAPNYHRTPIQGTGMAISDLGQQAYAMKPRCGGPGLRRLRSVDRLRGDGGTYPADALNVQYGQLFLLRRIHKWQAQRPCGRDLFNSPI